MSRVDDDREAERAMERQALRQRQDADKAKAKTAGESLFARKMQETKSAQDTRSTRAAESSEAERSEAEFSAEIAQQEAFDANERRSDAQKELGRGPLLGKSFQKRLNESTSSMGQARRQAETNKAETLTREALSEVAFAAEEHEEQGEQDQAHQELAGKAFKGQLQKDSATAKGRTSDSEAASGKLAEAGASSAEGAEEAAEGRSADEGEKAHDSARGKVADKAGQDAEGARADSAKQGRADKDGGGGKGKGDDDSGQNAFAGFRLNPALMAPAPVIQRKDTGASERLRALANEIAQKIVQSVRVGRNAEGMAEFQIDLKSNVLSGLSIKLSGSNGRIRAHFSGRDREVLKMLREQSEGLKAALSQRGLRLEELKIEAIG